MSAEVDLAGPHYVPPRALGDADVQSMLSGSPPRAWLLRRRADALRRAARPELIDVGGVRLLGQLSRQPQAARGLVVVLHGWEGCVDSSYVLSVGTALYAAGFDVFRLNFRDHGGTQALNEELFHSCRIDEIVAAVRHIAERYAGGPVGLAGYSLGGNFALRVAARAGDVLARVVAVCPVLNPRSTMHALETGHWVYRRYFLNRWRRSLLAKAAAFPHRYDFGRLTRFRTLTDTTDYFVRRYTEFPDLDSYLDGYAIVGDVLAGLSAPSVIIAAADDPIIPRADFATLATSPALDLRVFGHGGHCAFLGNYRLESWADAEVTRLLLEAFQSESSG